MTLITTHIGRVTIIRAPGDPMPAWLGGGCPEKREFRPKQAAEMLRFHIAMECGDLLGACDALTNFDRLIHNGEDVTLPTTEDQA